MVKIKITNIVLDNERFRVFFDLNNGKASESLAFEPGATAASILEAVRTRKNYFEELELQEKSLKAELVGKEV
jgi:hypothetical protein